MRGFGAAFGAAPGCTTCSPRPGTGIGPSRLQQTVYARQQASAARFFSQAMPLQSVQNAGIPPGSPVSTFNTMHFAGVGSVKPAGLGGLGVYNSLGCDSFDQAIKDLEELVRRGEQAGISSMALERAKTVLDEETGWNPINRTAVWPTNCRAQTARIAAIIAAGMADLPASARFGVAATVTTAAAAANLDANNAGKPPEDISPTAKFAIIGGITVVGIIGVAVITGQIAPLFRAVKRALP